MPRLSINPSLTGDGPHTQAVQVDPELIGDPGSKGSAYRRELRRQLAMARYLDWLEEKKKPPGVSRRQK